MTRHRDYHAEYLRRKPCKRDREKYLSYQRAYYHSHQAELYATSVERVRSSRARKARQIKFVAAWLDAADRYEYGRRCRELREELRL